jgi:hypothetical protein
MERVKLIGKRRAWILCATAVSAPYAFAQNEAALRAAFDGKYVTAKIDLPATHKGVDLRFDRENPFDAGEHASRIREHGIAIEEGRRIAVTHIKLKDDLIEFHLAGGGFNWGTDKTTQSFSATAKSSREKELERLIKSETDRGRKRDLQDELDDLRRDRERRDERRRREVEDYNERARERDQQRALRSGSRFNVRFKKRVPPEALTADGLTRYLDRWLDFSGAAASASSRAPERDEGASDRLDWLQKGMLRDDVEARLGRPRRSDECRPAPADLDCVVAVYRSGADEIEATFVEDVLVRFGTRR